MAVLQSGSITTNSSTAAVSLGVAGQYYAGVSGTFGSGTINVELSDNGGTTWIALGSPAIFTSAGWVAFQAPLNSQVRLTLTGATSPSITYFISA